MVRGRARSVSTAAVSFLVMILVLSSNGRTLALHLAGVLGRKSADRRPVERVAAMSQQGQEPVVQQAGERQRHAQIFGGRKGEPNIFVAEGRREPGRLES